MNHKLNEYKRENKQFDSEVIFKWMKDIINGLEVLRQAGIIHRDIKPG
jgi:serine/threonine protein kinase